MIKTYGVKEMSELFKKAPRTIIEDLARRPWVISASGCNKRH